MKPIKLLLFIVSIACLTLLFACPERKTVTTKINRDGSCTRSIGSFDPRNFKGIDSVLHDVPIPVDQSWILETINDSTAVLTKEFKTVSDLNTLYSSDESELKMYRRKVELTKKFRWFHTVFQFRETYEGLLTEIPLIDYMSEAEAKIFKMEMESSEDHPLLANLEPKSRESLIDNIEERFGFWLHDNIYSMAFDDIIKIADSLKLIEKQMINLADVKDTVKHWIDKEGMQMITFNTEDDLGMSELAEIIGLEIGFDSITLLELREVVDGIKLEEKYENEIFAGLTDDYDNELLMPGILTATNAELLKGDTLSWDVDMIKFIDSDYVMFAESKVTNRWAYVLSGFIILMAVIIPFIGKRRRQAG